MIKKKFASSRFIIVSCALVVLAVAISASVLYFESRSNEKVIFTIDGQAITYDEFHLVLQNKKALTTSYFKEKYNVDYNKNFWSGVYQGENPSEYAKRLAVNELLEIKAEQMLMKENDVIQETTYRAFLKNLQDENEQRQMKYKNNQPVYGPIQYSAFEYYSYFRSNNYQKLIEKLAKDAQNTKSDDFFQVYYKNIKDDYFKRRNSFDYEKISLKGGPGTKEMLQEIKDKASAGGIASKAAAEQLGVSANIEKQTLDPKKISKDDIFTNQLYETFLDLKEMDFSNIFETDREVTVFRVLKKQEGAYEEYKDVKSAVIQIYVQNQLDEKVKQYMKEAKVEINYSVYDKIIPQ
ncbi:hypothetical protein [Paenibacillus aceris]|uniref:peptidylprolyl isomerase n=1 Tax=Paenibacillus aceris TaxID=869555 RepID=A0ABS4HWF1_9BACL|nr:hypothetical protein [Paenibacillus aceris]MBP1962989.1 hypothetical protein [Paenibacillus aceris]NHW38414.1 hypothetical protein [Paenibacillus aceris]